MQNSLTLDVPVVNEAASIAIHTRNGSTNTPIRVTDKTSLDRAFQDILRMSHEVCGLRMRPSGIFP